MTEEYDGAEPIAIVGMAARVPGAEGVDPFWAAMRDGVESISRFDRSELLAAGVEAQALDAPDYVPVAAVIDDADAFDPDFFGLTAREAEVLDPQQRVLLECAWTALEDAGHHPAGTRGQIGVFVGTFMNKYLAANLGTNPRFMRSPMAPAARIFNDKDFLATRLAYLFDLDGPACTVQTACSTSLVAVHLACQSLLSYESDLALTGGVTVNLPLRAGYPVVDGGLFSADGHCRPFDVAASGTVPGNGAVVLLLRRLADAVEDGDHVYALIRGTAVNNDGRNKAGFTAPSVHGQAKVVAAAQAVAGVDAGSIGYLEAHGTATAVGDPIEVAALTRAFRAGTDRRGYCALGSVKANVGHLDAAAGAAGLMRAALALRHRQIPPSVNFTAPNPELCLAESPFYVPTRLTPWAPGPQPRRAGVSSFGVGGTNAHAVLEEAPARVATTNGRPWQVLPLSAQSRAALDRLTERLGAHLAAHPELDLPDVAFTLQDGRRTHEVRRIVVAGDSADAAAVLGGAEPGRLHTRTGDRDRRAVFAFPGGGFQHQEMGRDLYRTEPVFRAEVDRCAELLRPRLDVDLRAVLYPSLTGAARRRRSLGRAAGPVAVSALFVTEYALASLWQAWGVRPVGMIGHSLGEYVAACVAGVFDLPDALEITLARGELFAQLPPGRMLTVAAPVEEVEPLLDERLSVAAVNGPRLTVVAGPDLDIDRFAAELVGRAVECSRINVPVASHSWMVEPYLDVFTRRVKALRPRAPRIPFMSCVTGAWITAEEATDPHYWARHLREPVRFGAGLRTALAEPDRLLLEVGPGEGLTALASTAGLVPMPQAISSMGHPRAPEPELAHLAGALGRLWQAGVEVDWRAVHGQDRPQRVSLPGYPFQRRRYWISPGRAVHTESDEPQEPARTEDIGPDDHLPPRTERERQVAALWSDLLGVDRIGVDVDLFSLGAHSLMITQAARELRRLSGRDITARQVLQTPTVAAHAALADGRAVDPAMAAGDDLAADVVLDPAITAAGLPAPWSGPPRTALLTGATGFVGAFLCAELAERTSAQIRCLVRAADPAEGAERLRAALESYGLRWPGAERIHVIPGDLSLPRLGLAAEEYARQATELDVIYHCGAQVNFVRPYRFLRATNVRGTEEVLRLATTTVLKPVHHISTLAVLAGAVATGVSEVREDDPLPPPVGHDTAYSQSKWVAEGLVGLARERGVPVSVYRAGAVLPDSRTGAANREDYVTKVIQGCVELGAAPARRYELAVASVDHVARLVVGLSVRPGSRGATFHTVHPVPLAWNTIFAQLRRCGHQVRSLSWDDWRAELTRAVEEDDAANALAPLMAMLGEVADRDMPRMDCGNVLAGLPPEASRAPDLDEPFFDKMFGHFVRAGWLPGPQQSAPEGEEPRP